MKPRDIKLLLVEDNPDDAILMQETLSAFPNYEVTVCDRLQSALQHLTNIHFDVALLDLGLPDSQGLKTLLRAMAHTPDVPFIALTGSNDDTLVGKALANGAQDYLVKQRFDSDLLNRVILHAIDRHKARVALAQLMKQLQSSELRARLLIEKNIDGMAILDRKHTILFLNPAAATLFGQPPERLLGQSAGLDLSGTGPQEIHMTKPSGESVIIEARLVDIDWAGQPAYLTSLRDITERRRFEERLRMTDRMESIGRLAGGIAHDFNNLLTVIGGYSAMLLRRAGIDSSVHEDIEEIKKASDRAALLTNKLLTFSRKQVLSPEVLELNSVVNDIEKMLRRLISEDIEVILSMDPHTGRIKIDRGQLEQVLVNLAVNARDAMRNGGILRIETTSVEVDEAFARRHDFARPGRYAVLKISDNGCGMEANTLSHIFEPFFTTKEQGKGSGLGLSIVFGIVKQSNGYILVETAPKRGTKFEIYLPQAEQTARTATAASEAPEASRGYETLLIVEDEVAVRKLVRGILVGSGYTILEACHGPEALQICQGHDGEISLMLTDVVMPRMNGGELARRAAALRPEMKVLYMSAYPDEMIAEYGVLSASGAYLQKPFKPAALAKKIRELLDSPPAQTH